MLRNFPLLSYLCVSKLIDFVRLRVVHCSIMNELNPLAVGRIWVTMTPAGIMTKTTTHSQMRTVFNSLFPVCITFILHSREFFVGFFKMHLYTHAAIREAIISTYVRVLNCTTKTKRAGRNDSSACSCCFVPVPLLSPSLLFYGCKHFFFGWELQLVLVKPSVADQKPSVSIHISQKAR